MANILTHLKNAATDIKAGDFAGLMNKASIRAHHLWDIFQAQWQAEPVRTAIIAVSGALAILFAIMLVFSLCCGKKAARQEFVPANDAPPVNPAPLNDVAPAAPASAAPTNPTPASAPAPNAVPPAAPPAGPAYTGPAAAPTPAPGAPTVPPAPTGMPGATVDEAVELYIEKNKPE